VGVSPPATGRLSRQTSRVRSMLPELPQPDEVAIEARQRVIDDASNGDLPTQSDMNTIFGFLDAHAH
jgi:hypothetical protein